MLERGKIFKWAAVSLILLSFNRLALANKIIYVDDDSVGANDGSSWQDAYVYLQDALADANSSEKPVEIRVAQGFYKPDDGIEKIRYDLNSTFQLINGVTLSGGYAGISGTYPDERNITKYETILSGDLAMNDFAVDDPNNFWNEGDFYYSSPGRKFGLTLSHDFIVVVFREGLTLEEQEAFVESETNLGPFSERDDGLLPFCMLLALKKDLTREEIIQTINRLNQKPEVEYVNPELQSGVHTNQKIILLNRFSVKFIESATAEEIEAFNTANNVEIINQSQSLPNVFLLRMKDPKQRNILKTANFYHNDTITVYSQPDPFITNILASMAGRTSDGINNELSNLFLSNFNKVIFNDVNDAYDLLYEPKRLDNSYHVISCTNIDETAILDGFTVTAGNSPYSRYSGSGIYIDNSSPKLINCTFIGNTAYTGGGIYCFRNSNPSITNCLISDNTAAYYGGGIDIFNSSATILNCTITRNLAAQKGGGINVSQNSYVDITNSILWDNFSANNSQIAITNSSFSVSYCNIQNGQNELLIWENGNIDIDPLFADPNNGDYHLKSQAGRWDSNNQIWVQDDVTSPCIDAGDPNAPIGYEPFPNGGYINMGAYGGTNLASKSLSDLISFRDFWPFKNGYSWWNSNLIYDAGVDFEITDHLIINNYDVWHFDYEYITHGGVEYKDYYRVYINGGLYVTPNIEDINSLPDITGQMKLEFPEIICPNEPVYIPSYVNKDMNMVAFQGTLEEVLELSQTHIDLPEIYKYTADYFPGGNHENVLGFASNSDKGTILLELYGYHFGPMLQNDFIIDSTVDIETLVKITKPTEDESFIPNQIIDIQAEVVRSSSPVVKMEFIFFQWYLIGTDTDGSDGWSTKWEIPHSGYLPITVRATTESGIIVCSKSVYINIP